MIRFGLSKDKQLARSALTILALGHVLLSIPDDMEGPEGIGQISARVLHWHGALLDTLPANRLPIFNSREVGKRLEKFIRLCRKAGVYQLAVALWCCSLLVHDMRVSTPQGKAQIWENLDADLEAFARFFLDQAEGAEEAADKLYLEVCW